MQDNNSFSKGTLSHFNISVRVGLSYHDIYDLDVWSVLLFKGIGGIFSIVRGVFVVMQMIKYLYFCLLLQLYI